METFNISFTAESPPAGPKASLEEDMAFVRAQVFDWLIADGGADWVDAESIRVTATLDDGPLFNVVG